MGDDADGAVRAFRAALPGRLVETDLSAFDTTGAAVVSVALLDAPGGNGVGYGEDPAQARASAYGELAEWTRSHAVLSRASARRASWAELGAAGEEATDPRTLCLPAGSSWTPSRPLEWLTATRLRDGAPVWVPVDLLASRPVDRPDAGPRLVTPITNGLGAGLDPGRALAHALLELVQRDGNGLAFRALDRGVVVDLEGSWGGGGDSGSGGPDDLHDPAALAALHRLRAAGVEPVVKLASTEFGIAGVYAVGVERSASSDPLAVSAIGEAAHPDAQAAVRKALLELCASRARKAFAHGDLDRVRALAGDAYLDGYLAALPPGAVAAEEPRALAATVAWLRMTREELTGLLAPTVLSQRHRVPLGDLPSAPSLRDGESPADLAADVVARLAAAGLDVLVLDLSGDGVHAVKVLVPGLEVETMSYGRIGERGVTRARELGLPFVHGGRRGAGFGAGGSGSGGHAGRGRQGGAADAVPSLSPVLLTPEATERLGGPAWLDRDALDAVVGDLYPLYREPGRHLARLAMASPHPSP